MNDDITKLMNENIPAFHRSLKEGMYSSREIGMELFRSALNWINGLEKVASDAITRAENAEAEVERAEAQAHEFESEAIHNGEIMLSLAVEVAALKARIAELEAADQWHLVNDPPGAAGWYLGWTGRRIEIVRYLPEYEGDEIDWPWQDGDDDEIEIIYWSSLRNHPQEAPAP